MYQTKSRIYQNFDKTQKSGICNNLRALVKQNLDLTCSEILDKFIEDEKYYLTYDRLLKSVQKFIDTRRCVDIFSIFEDGNEDGDDMDFIIQYALFDKIVFC